MLNNDMDEKLRRAVVRYWTLLGVNLLDPNLTAIDVNQVFVKPEHDDKIIEQLKEEFPEIGMEENRVQWHLLMVRYAPRRRAEQEDAVVIEPGALTFGEGGGEDEQSITTEQSHLDSMCADER